MLFVRSMVYNYFKLCLFIIYLQFCIVNGQFFIVPGRFKYEEANKECKVRDAKLAVIRNEREQQLVYNVTKKGKDNKCRGNNGYCIAYIGLTRKGPGGTFEWIDGTTPKYKNWDTAGPKNDGKNEKNCTLLNKSKKYTWSAYKCTKRYSALCELSEKTKYIKTKATFVKVKYEYADMSCKATDSKLAVIRNEREQRLAAIASEKEIKKCTKYNGECITFIGFKRSGPDSNFTWIDGTTPKFTYWASDQPDNSPDDVKNCVVLKRSKWYNVVCDNFWVTALCELYTQRKLSSLNASVEVLPRPALTDRDSANISCGPTEYHTDPQTIVLTFGQRGERLEWRYDDMTLKFSDSLGTLKIPRASLNVSFFRNFTNSSLSRYFSVSLQTKYWVPNRLNVSFNKIRPVHAGPVSCFVASTLNKSISDKRAAKLNLTWDSRIYNCTVKPEDASPGETVTVTCCFDPGSDNKTCSISGPGGWTTTVGSKEWIEGYRVIRISWTKIKTKKDNGANITFQVCHLERTVQLPVHEPGSSGAVAVVIVVLILAFLVVTAIVVVVVIIAVRRRRGRKSDGGPSAAPLHNGDSPDAAGDGATKPMIPMQTTATPALA